MKRMWLLNDLYRCPGPSRERNIQTAYRGRPKFGPKHRSCWRIAGNRKVERDWQQTIPANGFRVGGKQLLLLEQPSLVAWKEGVLDVVEFVFLASQNNGDNIKANFGFYFIVL